MYCNTLACIAEMRAGTVSQYSLVYCDLRAVGGLALYCNTMHSQDSQPCRDTTGWALGWACWARRQALGRGRWGDGLAGMSRRAGRGRKRRRQARRGARSAGEQSAGRPAGAGRARGVGARLGSAAWAHGVGARRAAWACLCARPGRAGWSAGPSWCTVHLAQF